MRIGYIELKQHWLIVLLLAVPGLAGAEEGLSPFEKPNTTGVEDCILDSARKGRNALVEQAVVFDIDKHPPLAACLAPGAEVDIYGLRRLWSNASGGAEVLQGLSAVDSCVLDVFARKELECVDDRTFKLARFVSREDVSEYTDCSKEDGGPFISINFLQWILTTNSEWISPRGVRITGGRVAEKLDLQNTKLSHVVWLDAMTFESGVDFTSVSSEFLLSLDGSDLLSTAVFEDLSLENDLSFRGTTFGKGLTLPYAHIRGYLEMDHIISSSVKDPINLYGSTIEERFFFRSSSVAGKAILEQVNVGGDADFGGSKFVNGADMYALQADANLFLDGAEFRNYVANAQS